MSRILSLAVLLFITAITQAQAESSQKLMVFAEGNLVDFGIQKKNKERNKQTIFFLPSIKTSKSI